MFVRAWTSFLIPMLVALALYGVLAGRWLRTWLERREQQGGGRVLVPAVALGMLACCAFVLVGAANLIGPAQKMDRVAAERARLWDEQDAALKQDAADGTLVAPYERLPIAGLGEPFTLHDYAKDWVSACVVQYYHLQKLEKAPIGTLPR
jgi:hypothetical protein